MRQMYFYYIFGNESRVIEVTRIEEMHVNWEICKYRLIVFYAKVSLFVASETTGESMGWARYRENCLTKSRQSFK